MRYPLRVYADTSVFGGVFDVEFASASKAFLEQVRQGDVELVVSSLVLDELQGAPEHVRAAFDEINPVIVPLGAGSSAYLLRQAYLRANVVTARSRADALHVAAATVSGCRIIVSWNFKHIVNFRRISLYNGVNQIQGFGPIAIHTPAEVTLYEED